MLLFDCVISECLSLEHVQKFYSFVSVRRGSFEFELFEQTSAVIGAFLVLLDTVFVMYYINIVFHSSIFSNVCILFIIIIRLVSSISIRCVHIEWIFIVPIWYNTKYIIGLFVKSNKPSNPFQLNVCSIII